MKEIKLYNSITKPALRLLLFATLLGVSIYVSRSFAANWLVWTGLVLFGMPAVINLFLLADRRVRLVISSKGILDKAVHNDVVGWAVIKDAYAVSVYGRQFICIPVDDGFKPVSGRDNIYKRLALFTKSLGAKELHLSLNNMDVNAEKMAAFIVRMKAATDMEREQLLSAKPF